MALCCSVRPSGYGAEGPRDDKSCEGTRVATSSYMRPIATDTQQWRGRSIHAAYCYRHTAVVWSGHPCGLLLQTHSCGVVGPSMRPIATDVQQWRGQSIHAVYCYRRAAVAWFNNPRCLLLLGLWSNNRVANVQALPGSSSLFYCLSHLYEFLQAVSYKAK